MLHNVWPFGLAMFCGDISESMNRFLKHCHNEHSNCGGGGGGGCQVEAVDEVSGRKWSAIQGEAGDQAPCMIWLLAYFDVSWVVGGGGGGGGRSQVPCSGRDTMEVRRGHRHMLASLGQTLRHQQNVGRSPTRFDRVDYGTGILSCVAAMI